MKEKMRILVVEPVKRPYVKEIDHTLEEMQKVVGGSIQALYPFEDRVGLICNDEAKIAGGFTPNRALRDENGNVYDIIFGTFFILILSPETTHPWVCGGRAFFYKKIKNILFFYFLLKNSSY